MPVRDAPVPIAASWSGITRSATVTFSHDVRFLLDPKDANWFVRFDNVEKPVTDVSMGPVNVVVSTLGGVPDAGPNVVSYSPPPFDVVSDTLKPFPAAAFTDFPLV